MISILKADSSHYNGITEIYNEAIQKTTATFDTNIKTVSEMQDLIQSHTDKYPIMVAMHNNSIAGWASISPWSDRCAYSDTAENSVYVLEEFKSQGIGKILLHSIISIARENGVHTIIARITQGNPVSVHLHTSCGFLPIGDMKEVGRKFGKLLDVGLYQIIL
ncbi:MAG: N-acetyltransferase [Candidatus Marinimicrobia bacterium]|jgi:phosphinothricin acetyltransferase|nr:N-acetyltransferase [Candidatus Neomarinimicrobiota bacterium]MBT3634250.1 N-acetyltransferase [Candidatus Neomarinimicrobiota bacterium]MBT3682951.1 N-acetyltransferase [Candidatus Neomarinimicrobiota bacterium]MBT3760059.1 N-acetyltransferase [Candidatus Neomarinimicrobiota bacterium]MBT3896174.1 N-acetyltransferase [Candidatus Neomarinimicrobiota bacterium]